MPREQLPVPPHLPPDPMAEAGTPPAREAESGLPEPEVNLRAGQHAAISSFWLGNNLHWGALGMIVLPSQAERLSGPVHIPEAQITGWTIGLGAIVGTLVPPLVGAWSDRCRSPLGRRRPFVIWGTLINLVALGLFLLAFLQQSFTGFIAAWMLVGLGNNIATGAFSGIIPDVVPRGQRGLASSWMAGMQQVGTIGGFILGGQLMKKGSENDAGAMLVIVVVLLLTMAAAVAGTPERRLMHSSPFPFRDILTLFWIDPRRYPDFGWVWITRAFFTTGWWLIQPNLLYFMRDVVGASNPAGAVSLLGGVVLIGALATGIAGGTLSDRLGRRPIIFAAAMMMTLACILFALVAWLPAGARLAAVYAIAVIWGFGYGAYLSVDWALGTEVLPSQSDAGKDMGVWHLSMVVPQALAAPAAGLLLQPFYRGEGQGYNSAGFTLLFAVACTFMFLCGALIYRVRGAR